MHRLRVPCSAVRARDARARSMDQLRASHPGVRAWGGRARAPTPWLTPNGALRPPISSPGRASQGALLLCAVRVLAHTFRKAVARCRLLKLRAIASGRQVPSETQDRAQRHGIDRFRALRDAFHTRFDRLVGAKLAQQSALRGRACIERLSLDENLAGRLPSNHRREMPCSEDDTEPAPRKGKARLARAKAVIAGCDEIGA